jgi:MFS superfamily sulfate permease-like transporter
MLSSADPRPPVADHLPHAPPSAAGWRGTLRFDLLSGSLVFLIALPLCLGVARASELPPIAGVWTAVVGGLLTAFVSDSPLAVKGPAVGLIVVAAGTVASFGEHAVPAYTEAEVAEFRAHGLSEADITAMRAARAARQLADGYPLALGCALVAGVVQILLGLLGAGTLVERLPLAPAHGMLAAIGVTVMARQAFPLLGVPDPPHGTPWEVIASLPAALARANGAVAAVGLASLALLIAFRYAKRAMPALRPLPAPAVVLAVAVPLGAALGLGPLGRETGVGTLVSVPDLAFTLPRFDAVATVPGAAAVLMFCLVGSVESLLAVRAVDLLDPWRRRTDPNRDLLAVGVGNVVCAAVGALPMATEIVRSKANVDHGGRTRWANVFHAGFLLAFVLLLPTALHAIPAAALAAMLVAVGFRLADPREFVHAGRLGVGPSAVFVATAAVCLTTNLLVGLVAGVVLEAAVRLCNGVPVRDLLLGRPDVEAAHTADGRRVVLAVRDAAVFGDWPRLRAAVLSNARGRADVVLDLSAARSSDPGTAERLHELDEALAAAGTRLTVIGLDRHRPLAARPLLACENADVTAPAGV